MSETAIDKILKLLSESDYSTSEVADKLKMPLGTVRSTVSVLKRKRLIGHTVGKRGTPFTITQKGKEHLEAMKQFPFEQRK